MFERPLVPSLVVLLAVGAGCRDPGRENSQEPLKSSSTAAAGTVALDNAVQTAAGLRTERVTKREVHDSLEASGWLVSRPGSEAVVKSPVVGFLGPAADGKSLLLGQSVSAQQTLGTLEIFLSPQEQAQVVSAKEDADTAIKQAQASLEIAQAQLARLNQGSKSVVAGTRLQTLRETVARSKAAYDEAREKLPYLPKEPYGDEPRLRPTEIRAPIAGRITGVHVSPRQLVLRGDPLWTVADWSGLWVRVPVFVADLPHVQRGEQASVTVPGTHVALQAVPVPWQQPTETGRQTVDLFYAIDNTRNSLRPGQAVIISLPLGNTIARTTVPQSAILWDNAGDTWVYVRTDASHFRRRKIALGSPLPDGAVVLEGLREGEEVVTVGAEALYGEEFHWQIPQEDEDD